MVSKKWTFHKELSFASNCFIFWKFCFSLRTSYKELICCTNNPNAHICTFCERCSFILRCFFSVSILKAQQIFEIETIIPYRLSSYDNVTVSNYHDRHTIMYSPYKARWRIPKLILKSCTMSFNTLNNISIF